MSSGTSSGTSSGSGTGAHRPDLVDVVTAFGYLLHAAGVPVTPERSGRFASVVVAAAPRTEGELYWLGRVTLLTGMEQISAYDAVFGQVFRGWWDVADSRGDTASAAPTVRGRAGEQRPDGPSVPSPAPSPSADATSRPGPDDSGDSDDSEPNETVLATASSQERLAGRDFSALSADELDELRALIGALPLAPPLRPSRRRTRHRSGDEVDLRATLRRARRSGGDPVVAIRRRRRLRPRRLVLLADVSGSMESYARPSLHLLHGAVRATHAEAFVFSTQLTRLTRALATHDPDLALAKAAAAAPDWSGGTRIGAALKVFNDEYGRRGMARGAVVVIVSDGWEHDDPALLGEQLARLSRLAARIVWVNPRKASPQYEPLAGGMAAALPHVDAFVSGHSLGALDEVLTAISGDAGATHGRGRAARPRPAAARR